jgi:hypothetical protein
VNLVLGRLLEALPNTQLINAYPQASIGSTRHSHADPQADQHDRPGGQPGKLPTPAGRGR